MKGSKGFPLIFCVRDIFILVLSFHIYFGQVQSFTTFSHDRHKAQTPRVDEDDKSKMMEVMRGGAVSGVLSSALQTSLGVSSVLMMFPQPVLALDSLIAVIPTFLNDIDPRYFLSGGLCASISHGITTPVDVVKTRIQSDPQKYADLDILGATSVILDEDGYGVFLKGVGPTLVGYGLEGAAKFGLYESLKPPIVDALNLEDPSTAYIIASIVAGGVASIILCPLERTRIRLVTDPDFSHLNILTGVKRLTKETGVVGLFYGLPAMLSKQCPYTLGKQVTYDAVCTSLYAVVTNTDAVSTRVEVSFLAACCAAVIACILSQPGDVILTETYKTKNISLSSGSFSNVVSRIYSERQGVKGFYTGLVARLIQVGGIITSQLLLYDYIKQSLGLPATGSS